MAEVTGLRQIAAIPQSTLIGHSRSLKRRPIAGIAFGAETTTLSGFMTGHKHAKTAQLRPQRQAAIRA